MFTPLQQAVLAHLGDRQCHSGAALAAAQGLSRTAIWKAVQALQAQGIPLEAVRGRGYRLAFPYKPLLADSIRHLLPAPGAPVLVHARLDSTNTHLLNLAHAGAAHGTLVLAESQTRGRGRRGRAWISPFGQNLYLSILLRFEQTAAQVSPFSLVAALALAQTLSELGVSGQGVKWPNDIWWKGRKLAGILPELAGELQGPCALVLGVGLNVHAEHLALDAPSRAVSLCALKPEIAWDRNHLAARLATRLLDFHAQFCSRGFASFEALWRQYDVLLGKPVRVLGEAETLLGVARGITPEGYLLLDTGDGWRTLHSGEVSVRLAEV